MKFDKGETEIFVKISSSDSEGFRTSSFTGAGNAVKLTALISVFFLAIRISCDNKGANLITILSISEKPDGF